MVPQLLIVNDLTIAVRPACNKKKIVGIKGLPEKEECPCANNVRRWEEGGFRMDGKAVRAWFSFFFFVLPLFSSRLWTGIELAIRLFVFVE